MLKSKKDFLITVATVVNQNEGVVKFVKDAYKELSKHYKYFEILVVDNGSQDDTNHIVLSLQKRYGNIRLLRLSRTYEKETAVTAALDNSIGDFVAILNIQTDPLTLIPNLINEATKGFDVVVARPIFFKKSFTDRLTHQILSILSRKVFGYPLPLGSSYFRVFSRRAVNSLVKIRNKSRYLKHLTYLIGLRQTYVDYSVTLKKKTSLGQMLSSVRLGFDIMLSHSVVPLRFVTTIGTIASFINLLYFVYILLVAIFKKKIVEGWLTTNIMTNFMFLVLFIILTVLSEYIARILEEASQRPLYFIESEHTSHETNIDSLRKNKGFLNVLEK